MNRRLASVFLAMPLLLAAGTATRADPDKCEAALRQFNAAQNALADAVAPYSNCIAYSDGHQSCQDQFAKLQSAQASFQQAVSNYDRDCS